MTGCWPPPVVSRVMLAAPQGKLSPPECWASRMLCGCSLSKLSLSVMCSQSPVHPPCPPRCHPFPLPLMQAPTLPAFLLFRSVLFWYCLVLSGLVCSEIFGFVFFCSVLSFSVSLCIIFIFFFFFSSLCCSVLFCSVLIWDCYVLFCFGPLIDT